MSALEKMWHHRNTPYGRLICRQCAPEAYPPEALQEYQVDSYHVGNRFKTFELFYVPFTIYVDDKPTRACVEARRIDDESGVGWVIEQVVIGQTGPGKFEVARCACANDTNKSPIPAERLRFGRVKIVTKLITAN